MAEINKGAIVDQAAIQEVLDLKKSFEGATNSLMVLVKTGKELGVNIKAAESTKQLREETEKLTLAQVELQKVEKQIATIEAKNTEEYKKQAAALAAAKEQQKQRAALGEREAKSITAQNASLKQLEVALVANKNTYKALTTEEQRNSAEGKKLLSIIDSQQKSVKELNGSLGDFRDNVGDYEGGFTKAGNSLKTIAPGAAGAASGILSMVKASLAFIATPIGAIIAALGAALFALTSYFRGSEEGQNRLNKIVAVGSAIFEQFMNVVENIGEAVYDAFNDPKQAVIDFANLIKENVTNRFVGLMQLIPQLGKAIGLLFDGKFGEAGKVAANAVLKVGTGIDDLVGKTQNAFVELNKLVQVGVEFGTKIAAIQAKIDREERKLITERARINLEVSKLREEAAISEGGVRRQALLEAIALEERLSNLQLAQATRVRDLAALKVKANGDDKDALKELAEAEAALYDAQAMAYDNTLKFQKQIKSLNESEFNDEKKREDEELKRRADAIKKRIAMNKELIETEFLQAQKALNDRVNLIKQEVIDGKKTRVEGEKEIIALQKSLGDEYIQIQIDRAEKILAVDGTTAEERLSIEKELYKLRAELTDAYYKQIEIKEEKNLEKVKSYAETVAGIYQNFADAIGAITESNYENRIAKLDDEERKNKEKTDRELELAGDNEEEKKRIMLESEKNEKAINDRRNKERIAYAKKEKTLASFSAGIAAALAVLNALSTVHPYPLAVIAAVSAGILGAAQVVAIQNKPLPQYFTGVDSAPGGLAFVGERGTELMKSPSGKLSFTPSSATLMNVEKGTRIFNHGDTMRMLALSGLGVQEVAGKREDALSGAVAKKLDTLNDTIKNTQRPETNYYNVGQVVYRAEKHSETFIKHSRERNLGRKWAG